MKESSPYDTLSSEYDRWFDRNRALYELELKAVKRLIPPAGRGVEIGVGTGRFAEPLGIRTGVDPSAGMGRMAMERGVDVIGGVAESLPLESGIFDFALFVTVICFLSDVPGAMAEAFRVLKPGGEVIVGFIDRNSPMGKQYSRKKEGSRYYRNASFHSADEVAEVLRDSGFTSLQFIQTLINDPETGRITERVEEGYGEGSFVAVRGVKGQPEIYDCVAEDR